MPIYEFHCTNCSHDSEILVRSSAWEGTTCPHCGSTKLAKKLSVFASSVAGGESSEAPVCPTTGNACSCCSGGGHSH